MTDGNRIFSNSIDKSNTINFNRVIIILETLRVRTFFFRQLFTVNNRLESLTHEYFEMYEAGDDR